MCNCAFRMNFLDIMSFTYTVTLAASSCPNSAAKLIRC